jgi:hypothetical protein
MIIFKNFERIVAVLLFLHTTKLFANKKGKGDTVLGSASEKMQNGFFKKKAIHPHRIKAVL